MKIAYLVDSSFSISKSDKTLASEDCFFIPLHVIIDKEDYLDDLNLERSVIQKKLKKAKHASTSQPGYGEVELLLDEIINKGYDVLVCSLIGSGLSSTQNLVYSCAINKSLTVVNLDSKGVGVMQVAAIKMFKEELAKDSSLLEVQAKVQHMLDVSNCYAIVDDLNYLKRGGRISNSTALMGSILKVKPLVICSKDAYGKVNIVGKVRTRSTAFEKLVDIVLADIDVDEYNIYVAHFAGEEIANTLREVILERHPDQIIDILDLCHAIGVHTGLNTVAIFTVRK